MHCGPLAIVLFASLVSAQTTAAVITETDVGVYAGTTLNAKAKNTAVTAGTPFGVRASTRGASVSEVMTYASRAGHFGGLTLRYTSSNTAASTGTAAQTSPRNLKQAPHSFLLTLTGQRFNAFALTMVSRVAGRQRATIKIDIGADGRVEFMQNADGRRYTRSLPFAGAAVKVRVTVDAIGGTRSGHSVDIGLMPVRNQPGCTLTRYGTPCGRAVLAGRVSTVSTNYQVDLVVSGAIPSKPLAWVGGARQATIRLPGPCSLLTQPLIVAGVAADARGGAQLRLTFPTSTKGTAYLQAIPFDPARGVIMATNGLRVDCR